MPELLHQQPVLTLALDSFQDTTIDESDIRRMWILFTKCKDDIKNGFRLENISWRIWYKKYLNNTSDLFSNNKIYHKTMNNSLVHTVDSNSSSFSTIEPIEVLKKCACGEQLISSSLNSLLTPHSEYTCFNKLGCHHHQNHSSSMDTNEKINENDSLSLSQNTLVPSSIIPEQPSTDSDNNSEKTVKIFKEEEAEEKEEEEEKIVEEKIEEEEEENEENKITNEIPKEIPSEITHSEMNNKKEEAMTNCSNTDTTTTSTSTTTNDVGNNNYNTNLKENQNVPNHTPVSSIPPNCPTMEQFYQQQLLLLQQMYVQKQQQLQYQKQQMNVKPEQIYQQQLYLQQWYNQQQQQLLSNCSIYYKKYLQQYSQQVQAQAQKQAQAQTQTQIPSQAQQLKKESTNNDDDYDYDDDDDYDEDEDDDDFYYTDDDDEDYDDDDVDDYQDEIPVKEINEKDTKENKKEKEENDEDDLFKKVSTPTLKSKLNKSSLLSAMIKENNYNEYKKTIEIIQRYNEDVRDISYNIYSIKDYNHNCINSLNKNVHRKRAPSFEDLKNTQQGYRRLLGMHPLTTTTTTNNNQEQSQGIINSDIEEYYERNPHNNTNINGTNNSYSTVNTMSSQESHTTQYSGHYGCNGVYGSNKTTHSTKSTRSTISFLTHRTTNKNSISIYKNKKR